MLMLVEEAHANGMNVNNGLRVENMNGMIDNVNNNELRVRNVGDFNKLHVVNGLGTKDDFLNINENDRVLDNANDMPVSVASVRVSAASAPSMQVERNVPQGRVRTTQAVLHAAPHSTVAPVNRGISPFKPEPVVSRSGSAPATMSAVTCSTTTTTTARPYATRERDDFLRMSTTAHTRWIIRDPTYVTWHGPHGEILGKAEAPRSSLAPSYSMPQAIQVSSPRASQRIYQLPVEASTPLRPPPREHEEDPLSLIQRRIRSAD